MDLSLVEIFNKAKAGSLKMHSALGTRDEAKQIRVSRARINKMKTICGIKARVLVMKDISLPFNPYTGLEDDNYNKKTPFRPILLASQTIELIKAATRENSELAAFYETRLDGKFSNEEAATLEDYFLFKRAGFVHPRVMSYKVVSANFGGKCGMPAFKTRYTVDEKELNADGGYDYDTAPIHAKLATLFSSICREEWNEKKELLEAAKVSDDEKDTARRNIFAKSPVGFVTPYNVIPFFFFPLDIPFPPISVTDSNEVEQHIRLYNKTDKWLNAFTSIEENDEYDEVIDFYDFTITTPASGTATSSGKALTDEDPNAIYQALTIGVTDGRVSLAKSDIWKAFQPTYDAIKQYFVDKMLAESDDDSDVEKESFEGIVAASIRCRPINSVSDKLLIASKEIFNEKFENSKYFTDSIKKANAEILTAMNPENALLTAGYDDDEIKEASEVNFNELVSVSKEIDSSDVPEFQDLDLGTEE